MDVGSTGNACLRTKNFASHSRSFKVVKNYTDEYDECKFLLVNYCRPKYGPLMPYSTSSIGVTLKSRLGVEIMRDIGRKTLFFIPPCTVFNSDEPLKSLRISAQNFNTNCPKPWAIRWSKILLKSWTLWAGRTNVTDCRRKRIFVISNSFHYTPQTTTANFFSWTLLCRFFIYVAVLAATGIMCSLDIVLEGCTQFVTSAHSCYVMAWWAGVEQQLPYLVSNCEPATDVEEVHSCSRVCDRTTTQYHSDNTNVGGNWTKSRQWHEKNVVSAH